jgi:uncharacterized membrane protein YhhN
VNPAAGALIGVAAAFAIADWIAVSPGARSKPAEFVFKPATMLALIGVALALDPERDAQRGLFVVALVLSLAGDVFLMLPRDLFVAGLASFLLGHVFYIAGFALEPLDGVAVTIAAAGVLIAARTVGRRILSAVRRDHPKMLAPVAVYMTVIGVMVILAIGTAEPVAAAGAILFFASDSMIAWDRFVKPFIWARPAIMITYHLAQGGLVLSLVS